MKPEQNNGSDAAILDMDGTLRRLGGNMELVSELTEFFYADSPRLVERLADGLAGSNGQEVRHAAHSLRGLVSNFGAASITSALSTIETSALDGNFDEVNKQLPLVIAGLEELRGALAPYRKQPQTVDANR
jgi:HPt (histidine-containing phosphotransfer) domain-containing protein